MEFKRKNEGLSVSFHIKYEQYQHIFRPTKTLENKKEHCRFNLLGFLSRYSYSQGCGRPVDRTLVLRAVRLQC